jgi:hypothetical protein
MWPVFMMNTRNCVGLWRCINVSRAHIALPGTKLPNIRAGCRSDRPIYGRCNDLRQSILTERFDAHCCCSAANGSQRCNDAVTSSYLTRAGWRALLILSDWTNPIVVTREHPTELPGLLDLPHLESCNSSFLRPTAEVKDTVDTHIEPLFLIMMKLGLAAYWQLACH